METPRHPPSRAARPGSPRPGVPLRDRKAATDPALVFSEHGWSSFVTAVKHGRST
ncbi:DUF397 domain-containing protein [Streptomyces sp. NPDC056463]|uniref:DUF397 domain-containing protein n=1 Tax=unclassified Streptomyces TaxID=2593676 RepID=UPI00368FE9A6